MRVAMCAGVLGRSALSWANPVDLGLPRSGISQVAFRKPAYPPWYILSSAIRDSDLEFGGSDM